MGLYGALIVRPAAATQAYGDASTAFDNEAVLVLSELDPALAANPAGFDMRNYAPRYFLINGKAYPATATISSAAGSRVLLRYVNAGIQHHSIGVLGLRQNFVAKDASLLPTMSHNVAAETLAPGQTGDAIATIPATTTDGSKFAVYDGSLMLHNSNAAGIGGMLTFLIASGATSTPGPTVTALALAGQNLTATIAASSPLNVANWQYWIDSGAPTTLALAPPAATVSVSATIPVQSTGNHNLYVRGQDDATPTGTWGAIRNLAFAVDTTGPVTSGLTLTPNPSSGIVNVALHATGNDSTTGGSNIAGAEYFIGSAPDATVRGTPMSVNAAAPVASLDATIACTVGSPCAGGAVNVRSRDALGNWGAFASITLNVVAGGPTTTNVVAARNPNNGAFPLNASQAVVRVTATMTGNGSNVTAAEGFLCATAVDPCSVGAPGTGFTFIPSDGAFDSTVENGYSDIPLATINALTAGNHTIYVRGKDATGNWGATATTTLLIDKTAPTFTGISLAPSPTLGATSVTLTVSGSADPLVGGLASGVAGGEYWIDAAIPAPGGGTPFAGLTPTIPVSALATGNHTVGARIRDAAGNWSATTSNATVFVVPDAIFANGFETAAAPWGWSSRSTTNTTRLNRAAIAAMAGSFGLQAQGNNTNYVQYNFGTTANPAWPTYDARFHFNPNNNASTGQDVFAAATSAAFGTQLFHVRYRRSGAQPQVQIQVGATANAAWVNINNNADNSIEVVWQSGNSLVLYVNGVQVQTLATASTGSVGAVRLGSVTSGGSNTLEFFDAFSSKRTVSPLIGP
jgi:hypothetical protein